MFKKKIVTSLILSLAIITLGAGCDLNPFSTNDTNQKDKQRQQNKYSLEQSKQIAMKWIKNESPTYTFDGSKLEFKQAKKVSTGGGDDCKGCYQFLFEFESSQAGYGNREGQMSAQVITPHEMKVVVQNENVVTAITDGKFDEMKAKMIQKSPTSTDSNSQKSNQNQNTSSKKTKSNTNTTSQKNSTTSQKSSTTSQRSQSNTQSGSVKDIKVSNLESNDLVPKVFAIRGEAPSDWFFEGDFPIEVHPPGTTRHPYTSAIAKTDENYMTKDRVNFYAVVDMRGHNAEDIIVQFKKDNPSGKKSLDDSERIGLRLEQAQTKQGGTIAKGIAKDGCVISGCSNQFCASKGKVGNCSVDPADQCRRSGICSKDQSGNCRWLQDSAMKSCLNTVKQNP